MPAEVHSLVEDLLKRAQAVRLAGDRTTALSSLGTAQAIDPQTIQLALDRAKELRARDRSADAGQIYRAVRQLNPDNFAATVGLAQLESEQKNQEASLALFREAHRQNPQHVGVQLEIGRLLRDLGRLDEAELAYTQVLAKDPRDIGAAIGHALVHRARKDREKSLATLQAAAEFAPRNVRVQLELVNDLRHLKRVDEARNILEQITAEDPDHFDARIALGHLKREQADRLGALAQFQHAAALRPNHPGPKLQAAQELRELGRLAEAEACLDELLAQQPDNVDARAALGTIKRQQGDRLGSLAQFQHAMSLNPGHAGVKLQAARGLRECDRLQEAEALLDEILTQHPENFEAYLELGHIARQRGDKVLSLAHFRRGAALNPKLVGPRMQCAQDLRELGRLDEAEKVLADILGDEPTHAGARIGLALIHRRRGDRHRSLLELQAARDFNPKHVGIRLEIANDLREIGRLSDALASINSALALDPNHANAHAQLGQLYRAGGDYLKARDSYATACTLDPHALSFRVELANCDRELGKTALAEAELRRLSTEHPDNIQAALSLATLLMETFRLDEAEAILNGIERNKPTVPILLALGRLARRADRRADALGFFQRAHELEPEHSGPLLELVQEHRAQGKLAEALAINEILVKRDASLQTLLDRGRIHRDQGDRDLAIEAFKSAATKFPEAWQARLELAIEHRLLGEPYETERLLRSILDENGNSLPALEHLIEFLRMAERFDEALEHCFKAMSLRPSLHWPYMKAAHIAARLGRTELIWKLLDDGERQAGPHPEITAARIELLRFMRRLRQAEDFVRDLSPERLDHFAVGAQAVQTAITLGQPDIAQERLNNLRPQTVQARSAVLRLAGKIREVAWDHEGAIAQYALSLEGDPHNAGTHHEIAKCSLLLLRPSAALVHLGKSLELGKSANILRGASHNSSQNHLGQLINEFLLDADLLMELSTLHTRNGSARLKRLTDLVLLYPDNTSSAIGLLVELRKAGRLSIRATLGKPAIPQSIVQFWDDPNPPDEIRELCASWSRFNPDFSYDLFNENSAADFLRQYHPPEVHAAFDASREAAQKADLFRLAYLAVHGGFYADCDDRCATRLEDFIPSTADFVAYQEEYGTLGNNFIGATPNHPVICRALDLAVEAINRNDNDIVWLLTGPGLLTRAYASIAAEDAEMLLSRSAIFTVGEIQRYLENHCPAAYKLTDRHWLKSTFIVQRRKFTRFRPGQILSIGR